jgi:hypothetical protein
LATVLERAKKKYAKQNAMYSFPETLSRTEFLDIFRGNSATKRAKADMEAKAEALWGQVVCEGVDTVEFVQSVCGLCFFATGCAADKIRFMFRLFSESSKPAADGAMVLSHFASLGLIEVTLHGVAHILNLATDDAQDAAKNVHLYLFAMSERRDQENITFLEVLSYFQEHRPELLSLLETGVMQCVPIELKPLRAESDTFVAGEEFNLQCVPSTGTKPMAFSWFRNGEELVYFPKRPTLTIGSVRAQDEGEYYCKVSNMAGFALSSSFHLVVQDVVHIVQQPQSSLAVGGQDVKMPVKATGTAPISYQWLHNGEPLDGNRTSGTRNLVIRSFQLQDEGEYSCVISNLFTTATTEVVNLRADPIVLVQPKRTVVLEGGDAVFYCCSRASWKSDTYMWTKDGQTVNGQNSDQLRVRKVTLARFQIRITSNPRRIRSNGTMQDSMCVA